MTFPKVLLLSIIINIAVSIVISFYFNLYHDHGVHIPEPRVATATDENAVATVL